MIRRLLVCAFLWAASWPMNGQAAQLVMVNSATCGWCEQWEHDIGQIYGKTAEARILPLSRVDIFDLDRHSIPVTRPVYYTPTFVVIDNGREVGRIQGYPGPVFFWTLLQEIIVSQNLH